MPTFQYIQPKTTEKIPSGWLGKLFRFSVIIFLIVIIFFIFCDKFYKPYLEQKISILEDKILNLEKEIPSQDRAEVIIFYSQLNNLRKLLSQHFYPSQIFQRLELITHPQISFNSFSYEAGENRLKFEGYAKDLNALAEQLLAFQRSPDFTKINLLGIKKGGDRYNFSLEVFFKKSFLLKQL